GGSRGGATRRGGRAGRGGGGTGREGGAGRAPTASREQASDERDGKCSRESSVGLPRRLLALETVFATGPSTRQSEFGLARLWLEPCRYAFPELVCGLAVVRGA